MSDQTKQALVFLGMPGSGKSVCVDYLVKKGLPRIYFGSVTFDEMEKRGLVMNQANERLVREDIRAKEGKDAYANRIIKQLDELFNSGKNVVVVESLYSWTEYKMFKEKYGSNAIMIAVVAPLQIRHERLLERPVRPLSEQAAVERDYSEIEKVDKGGPIANADYFLNNQSSVNDLISQLDELLDSLGIFLT